MLYPCLNRSCCDNVAGKAARQFRILLDEARHEAHLLPLHMLQQGIPSMLITLEYQSQAFGSWTTCCILPVRMAMPAHGMCAQCRRCRGEATQCHLSVTMMRSRSMPEFVCEFHRDGLCI